MLRSAALRDLPHVPHGLTTRAEGSVGPGSSATARRVRSTAVCALGGDPARLVTAHQVHGARVAVVGREEGAAPAIPETDALVTVDPGTVLMVRGADCPLILLADPVAGVLALAHSGWRGTVAEVGARTVSAMVDLGADPGRLRVGVFPGIARCCFEVGPEVVSAFDDAFAPRARAWRVASPATPGHALLDLHAAIKATLVAAGVAPAAIDLVAGCTACGGDLWSYRASGGRPERHGLFAGLL